MAPPEKPDDEYDDGDYDEFSYFGENLREWGLTARVPVVRRFFVAVDGLRQLSGLAWGDEPYRLALVHGGGQNAHTFDTVALALERPLVAIDLAGHGHSDPAPFSHRDLARHGDDLIGALEKLVEPPCALVGMSLGGLCSIVVAAKRPDLVSRLVLIDITPGVTAEKARHVTDFVNGPATFDSFDELLARTIAHNPTRSESSLRRGILHNARRRRDGTWVWRHQQSPEASFDAPDVADLWATLRLVRVPVALVRGMAPGSVVDDDDEAAFVDAQPRASVVHVDGAGHSIQGDQPLELATALENLCFPSSGALPS